MCYGKLTEKVFEYRHYGVGGVKVLITNIAFGDHFNKYLNGHAFMSICTLIFFGTCMHSDKF